MDERIPYRQIIIKCVQGKQKNTSILHIFEAHKFKTFARIRNKQIHPQPPLRDNGYWDDHYRIRIDGRWYSGEHKRKYVFFTADDINGIINNLVFK